MTSPAMPPISTTGNDRFSKILFWVSILIIPTILIIQVLVYQPFFGHMDDGTQLIAVRSGRAPQTLLEFATRGGSLGFPGATGFSMLLTWPLYGFGSVFGSVSFFTLNVVVTFSCLLIFLLGLRFLGLFSNAGLVIAVSSSFLWPFTAELIFFPSLQEKAVVLATGLYLMTLRWSTATGQVLAPFFLSIGCAALMLASKTQVIVFAPTLLLLFILNWKRVASPILRITLFFLPIVTAAILVALGMQSSYAVSNRTGTFFENAQGSYAMLILGLVVVYGVYVGVRFLRGRRNYLELVPLVMMATFWASIVYFGYRNYFLSIFGVMFGSAVAVVVGNLKSVKLQQLTTVGLIVVTVGWTLYRIPQVFEPLHGIGAFTQGQIARDLADEGAVIYTSCVEGSGHFNYYTERKWGVTPEFKPLEGDGAGYRFGIPDDGQYVFGDRRLCAAPGEIAAWDVVWASPGDDGFRLYKRPA